jgi:hypothetical protein
MTTSPTISWSATLQQQTRQAVEQLPVTPDGQLHFKHPTLGYAYAALNDLMHDRLILHSKTESDGYRFDDVEALLQTGWVVD